MSIIYSYPEQGALNENDMLIGTSTEVVGGKQKNITRNFSIKQISDFIRGGDSVFNPAASDFQIGVFNQGGTKLTGSIMSQNAYPNGSLITITGGLTTTGNSTTSGNALIQGSLTSIGAVTLGSNQNLISLNSQTRFNGPVLDVTGSVGGLNQILISNGFGNLFWTNYEAGLTYEGTWDATNNTTNGLANAPALISGQGISGHFYIVNTGGNVDLDGNNSWSVGDWAIFLDEGSQPASWQKIDNSSEITGSGTANTMSMWTNTTTLNDSLISQNAGATIVSVNGELKIKDTLEATTTNSNLKLKGNGTGGVEIMSADGVTDGKIQLNCSQNSHGVTIQSPAHAANATYTLVLPTTSGVTGDVLTSGGVSPSQLTWTTPTVGTVTNFATVSTAITGITTVVADPTTTPTLTLSITGTPGAGLFLDGTGNWSSPGGGVTDITATAPLNADVATGSVTLSMPAYVTATGGYVPSGGATGQYLDGLSGSWTTLPAGDTYTLGSSTDGSNVKLNLDAASGTDSAITLTGAGGLTVAQTNNIVTLTAPAGSDTTYTLAAGAKDVNSVPLNLSPSTGSDTTVKLTEGTGITLTQTSATEITIEGTAQGITGSGTVNQLPKFGTTTSLTDSLVSETIGVGVTTEVNVAAQLDMTTHQIKNVVDPTDAQDAVTKVYVDTAIGGTSQATDVVQATTITPLPGMFWTNNNRGTSSYPVVDGFNSVAGGFPETIDLSTTAWRAISPVIGFDFGSPNPENPNSGAPARTLQEVNDQADALRAAIGWPAAGITTTATDITFTLSFNGGQSIVVTQPAGALGPNTNSNYPSSPAIEAVVTVGTNSNPITWGTGSGTITSFSTEPGAPPADYDSYALPVNAVSAVYIEAPLLLQNNRISSVADPTQDQDAATRNYVDNIDTGVTSVATADANLITIAGTGSGPYTGAVTATANTAAVSSSSSNLATGSQIQTAIDTALAGTLTFKGTFNAASGLVTSGVNNGLQLYSGNAGVIAITQGDFYIADTAGSFYNTTAMNVGDEAIALFTVAAAPPGSAITDWSVVPAQSSGGTVTSVGLGTDVAAFAVTNSPVTGSGTLTLNKTGGSAGQFLRQDGTWAATPNSTGGPFLPITGGSLTGNLGGTTAAFSSTLSAGQAFFSGNIRLNGSSGELIGPIDNNLIIRAKPTAGNAAQGVKLWNNNVLNASFLEGGNVRFHGYGATPNVRSGTAVYSLAVTSAGIIIQEPVSGGGTVTGTGTATQVAFWDAASNINGDTAFNWDNTNKRLGIGPGAPAEQLYVNASSGDARIGLNAVSGSDTEIKFSNAGIVQYSIGHDDATDNFVIGTTNVDTPKVSISKAGNVGIGTATPTTA